MPRARNNFARFLFPAAAILVLAAAAWFLFFRPTRILVANATLAQQADVALNNDSRRIRLRFADADALCSDGRPLHGTDAVVIFSRGLYLDEAQAKAVIVLLLLFLMRALLVAAIGVAMLQVKQRWYARESNDLEFIAQKLSDEKA